MQLLVSERGWFCSQAPGCSAKPAGKHFCFASARP